MVVYRSDQARIPRRNVKGLPDRASGVAPKRKEETTRQINKTQNSLQDQETEFQQTYCLRQRENGRYRESLTFRPKRNDAVLGGKILEAGGGATYQPVIAF